jgi:hypothetical protein
LVAVRHSIRVVSFEIRALGQQVTLRHFATLEEVDAYAAGAYDLTDRPNTRDTLETWAVWRVDDTEEREVVAAGQMLRRASAWGLPAKG